MKSKCSIIIDPSTENRVDKESHAYIVEFRAIIENINDDIKWGYVSVLQR